MPQRSLRPQGAEKIGSGACCIWGEFDEMRILDSSLRVAAFGMTGAGVSRRSPLAPVDLHRHWKQRVVHGAGVLVAPVIQVRADALPEESPRSEDKYGGLTGPAAMDAIYSEAPKAHRDAHRPTGDADIEGDWEHPNEKRHSDENEEENESGISRSQSREPLNRLGAGCIRRLSEGFCKSVAFCRILLHFPHYRKVGRRMVQGDAPAF